MQGWLWRKVGVILQSLSSKIDFYIKNPLKIALSRDKICPSQKKAVSLHAFSRRAYAQAHDVRSAGGENWKLKSESWKVKSENWKVKSENEKETNKFKLT